MGTIGGFCDLVTKAMQQCCLFPACLSGDQVFPHVLQVDFHKLRIGFTF